LSSEVSVEIDILTVFYSQKK